MNFRFNCWLLALGCFAVCALLPAGIVQGSVYSGCPYSYWQALAMNAQAHGIETFIIAHGDNSGYYAGCLTSSPVVRAMDIPQSGFSFFALCGAMNKTGPGTVSSRAMESVGYRNLDTAYCTACWNNALQWQDYMFRRHEAGMGWADAYEESIRRYPECAACSGYFNRAADIVEKIIKPWLLK